MFKYLLLLSCLPVILFSASLSISQEPYAIGYGSNLPAAKGITPLFVGKKSRLASCSGVAWMPGDRYLATVNLVAPALEVYEFDEAKHSLRLVQVLDHSHGINLEQPENLDFSKDGKLLVVTNAGRNCITAYQVDPDSGTIDPHPLFSLGKPTDHLPHGIQFYSSSNADYLAYTIAGYPGRIDVYEVTKDQEKFTFFNSFPTPFPPRLPKSLGFSSKGDIIAICYNVGADPQPNRPEAIVATFKMRADQSIDPTPISKKTGPHAFDDVKILFDSYLVVSDQAGPAIMIYDFDPVTGAIGDLYLTLKNPEAKLTFPHGIGVSRSEKYLAVANYGNNSVTVYAISCSE